MLQNIAHIPNLTKVELEINSRYLVVDNLTNIISLAKQNSPQGENIDFVHLRERERYLKGI